ncbi:hypothetical protein DDA93_05155 [Arthrobacter sp. Bz4]|nr:hypothetical protein DDA93_05155 [Arthrobacter sp. Bz4]
MFIGAVIIGYILAGILMIFIPPLRNGSAATILAFIVGVVITWAGIGSSASLQKAFLRDLLDKINDTVLGITGNPNDRLSASDLRALIKRQHSRSLLVNGVPGVELRSRQNTPPSPAPKPSAKVKGKPVQNQPKPIVTTTIFICMTAPDLGLTSFDRLLDSGE